MKTPIFILRFGVEDLIPLDGQALGHLQDELEYIGGCSLLFGILTLIMTDKSPKHFKDLYLDAGTKLDDRAPVIVWDPSSDRSAMNLRDFPDVKGLIDRFEKHHGITIIPEKNDISNCSMSLDELIDKVGRTGRDSLTPIEFARLEVLSKNP